MSLQHLADYCQQCVNIKQGSQKIEEAGRANVRKIYRKHHSPSHRRNWKSPSSTNKNYDPPLLAHAMDAETFTGTMIALVEL